MSANAYDRRSIEISPTISNRLSRCVCASLHIAIYTDLYHHAEMSMMRLMTDMWLFYEILRLKISRP
ncbi:hypothetical protein ACTXT7_000157 [Hymenolepis weldensis]